MNSNKTRNISSECMIQVDGNIYIVGICGNYLYKKNVDSKYLDIVGEFEKKEIRGRYFSKIVYYAGKLYFIPLAYDKVAIFDISKCKIDYIDFPEKTFIGGKFSNAFLRGGYIYFIPAYYPGILKMKLKDNSVVVIDSWVNDIDYTSCVLQNEAFFRGEYIEDGDSIYIPMCNAHVVFEFQLDTNKYKIHDVGMQGYSSIVRAKEVFYLAPRKGNVITKWNVLNNQVVEIKNLPDKYNGDSFLGGAIGGKFAWFFPERANMVLKIDLDSDEVIEEELFIEESNLYVTRKSEWDSVFIYKENLGECLLLCSPRNNRFIKFYVDEYRKESFELELSQEANEKSDFVVTRGYINTLQGRPIVCENIEDTLADFIADINLMR